MKTYRTELATVDPLHPSLEVISRAASIIRRGDVVAFPTETVYGLGADATSDQAVSRIYQVKQRPSDNPLIAHFSSVDDIAPYASDIPELAYSLADAFWPGPLTLVLRRTDLISSQVTKDLGTIAVRVPAHPVAISLIRSSGVPIAAPSANLSGRPSPTTAAHVMTDFDGRVPMVIDGGSTSVGVESTVVNLTTERPVLLRPGGVTIEELRDAIPQLEVPASFSSETPQSPGMKYVHYTPDAELIVVDSGKGWTANDLDKLAKEAGGNTLILCTNPDHDHLQPSVLLGRDFKEVQVNLFASFRLLDDRSYTTGIFEGVDKVREGYAIMNRAQKAANRLIS